MNGRNHLATGAAIGLDMCLGAVLVSSRFPDLSDGLNGALSPFSRYDTGFGVAAGCAACALCYMFGTVLPDIDNGGIVSKWLHFSLPLAHRGWTHSIWAILLVLFPSVFWQSNVPAWLAAALWPIRFVAVGMLAHDLMDALSKSGWCVFYPLGRWRKYESTIMKRGWTPSFYSSSRPGSENIVAGLVVFLSLAWIGFGIYLVWSAGLPV